LRLALKEVVTQWLNGRACSEERHFLLAEEQISLAVGIGAKEKDLKWVLQEIGRC